MKLEIEIDTDDYSFPSTPEDLREYAATLRRPGCGHMIGAQMLSYLAAQWEAKLPKPRMDEPAWGEKVIAHNRLLPNRRVWLRVSTLWRDEAGALTVRWDDLIDPVPFTPEAAAALS